MKCNNCFIDGHDTCWVDEPDLNCSCCRETCLAIVEAEIQGYVMAAYREALLK